MPMRGGGPPPPKFRPGPGQSRRKHRVISKALSIWLELTVRWCIVIRWTRTINKTRVAIRAELSERRSLWHGYSSPLLLPMTRTICLWLPTKCRFQVLRFTYPIGGCWYDIFLIGWFVLEQQSRTNRFLFMINEKTTTTTTEPDVAPRSRHHQKLASKFMRPVPPPLMSDTVQEIENTFAFFDLNADQMIDADELRRVLHAVNVKKSNEECQEILNGYDLNGDGKLDVHEFIFALARLIKNDVFTLNDIHQRFQRVTN